MQQWAHSKAELTIQVSGHVDMPTCKQICKANVVDERKGSENENPLADIYLTEHIKPVTVMKSHKHTNHTNKQCELKPAKTQLNDKQAHYDCNG